MNKTISIIIPTYGRPTYLKRAIESCINQTYKNIEIIIVDDNSPGSKSRKDTENVMNSYSNNNKIIYLKHLKNRGGAAARNTGIANSEGSYISFLDDDDEYLEERLERCFDYCESNKFSGVITDYCLNKKKRSVYSDIKGNSLKLYSLLSKELNIGTGSNLFFKKELLLKLGGFDEKFIRHQDIEILARYLKVDKLGLIKEHLVIKNQEDKMNYPNPRKLSEVKKIYLNKFKEEINSFSSLEREFILDIHNKEVIREYFKNFELKKGLLSRKLILNKKNNITILELLNWSSIGLIKKILKYLK